MDLFEFDFFRDWELEQQCHYEQDRSALKKREWERRTQEVQQDEDLFSSGFNLFGEPYKTEATSLSTLGGTNNLNKTNKGDALANRVQNTLGNYDEMKELLTSHSNQSHLVGIPKNSVPQTPGPSFFTEGAQRTSNRTGTGHNTTSMPPPPSSSSLTSSTRLSGHQSSKKSRSSDWLQGAHCSSSTSTQEVGGQVVGVPTSSRGKHLSTHEQQQQQPQRHEELFSSQGDVVGHKGDSSSSPNSSTSRRHGAGQQQAPSAAEHGGYKDSNNHVKSPLEQEPGSHGSSSPVASTSLLPSGLSTPTFPQGLHVKPSAVQQQKPTAYVRPMDGQDQVPLDSPELKPPLEVGDVGYSNLAFGSTTTSSKSKLPKLTLTQTGEVSLSSDSSCVEEILREMTHSWPPPLTAIHTPGKAEQTKFPIPSKESQHLPSGYAGQKRCNVPGNKPATKSVPQKSMLEDDLKISSDEEDTDQQAAEKPKPRSTPLSIPVATSRTTDPGLSSGASGSSSESESSSESDSDSESSSSDSECNGASRTATPEPEPPSTNKWQLDKWLNKVTPHNKALINTQPERESHGLSSSQTDHNQQAPEGQGPAPGKSKPGPAALLAPTDPKERALLSPIREKAKPKTGPKVSEGKGSKVKSPAVVAVEPAPARRSLGKKQPKKVERSSSLEEHTSWSKPINPTISTTSKEKDPPSLLEQPKSRTKSTSGKTAPRKEPRTTTTITPAPPPLAPVLEKKKHRGPSKIIPKSKEFIETESSSSECHSEPEELVKIHNPPCPGPSSLQTLKAAKDCNSNILTVSSLTSTCSSSISIPDPGAMDLLGDPLFSSVPIVQNKLLSPLRDFEDIKSLWVKIELSFLSKIPGQDPPEPPSVKVEPREPLEPSIKHRRQSPASLQSTPVEKPPSKAKRKHKMDHCDAIGGSKKLRLEKDSLLLPPCISPIHNHKNISTKDSLRKQPRKREEKRELLPPLLSPLSDEPPIRQRRTSECSSFSQEGGASSATSTLLLPTLSCSLPNFSSSSSSSSHKHRSKGESKSFSRSKTSSEEDTHSKPSGSFHGNGQSDSDVWSNPSSLSMDHMEPRRPKLTFNNTVHNADYCMQEAKKLKHKADALMEKFGKAINYADGALSFIECGNAMERDPLEAKSPYTMYSETVELIRYAMRLKNFTSHSATVAEKKLAVLCNRCLSLLYLRMFKLKKDHAVKYSRSLMEYFKKSSQAPSPWGANGKSTGTPSPLSLSPSPVSSVSSSTGPGLVGSCPSGASSNVAIPQRIHHMAASHVNITNNILRSYEHWDTAEKLATESQEFFQELDSTMEPLSQHSSMTELVRYIRQGLHWLRIEAHML
uniref:AF4/FMR2 C-terminal homology domain-containing protein n=1 Tax=Oncorhynchus tshawytscha TaxID=74940 RepID=A0AAZ3RTH8_ONCTS